MHIDSEMQESFDRSIKIFPVVTQRTFADTVIDK